MHRWITDRLDERRSFSPLTEGKTEILRAEADRLVLARVLKNEAIIIDVGGNGQLPALPLRLAMHNL